MQAEILNLRRSRRRQAAVADADRREIERALHEGVQQHLVALAVDLQIAARLVETDPAAGKALLDEMATIVRQALDEAAELALRIYPALLAMRGLASALRMEAEKAGVMASIDVIGGVDLPVEITTAVYWGCVEALSAAPAGTKASVRVTNVNEAVSFEVAVGGSFEEVRMDRIRDRIEALGGRVTVEDAHDGSSQIHGWVPLSG